MNKLDSAIRELHRMDMLTSRNQWVNHIHPLVKLMITLFYLAAVVSFSRYDVIGTAGMIMYPLVLFQLSELSMRESLRRIWIALPLVCFIGIWNPIFDNVLVNYCGLTIRAGVLSMLTLILKGIFCVLAGYLLIATTTTEQICYALCLLHIPSIFVTQFQLTYRYISVRLEETNRLTQAYSLRAPHQTGIHFRVWGSLVGQLLLRSIDRANRVYESMVLRGYQGNFDYIKENIYIHATDILYLLVWLFFCILFRCIPVFWVFGQFLGGVL